MSTEKRVYQRYAVWFPVTLLVDGAEIGSICRDASPSGILVSASYGLPVGQKVRVRFRVSADETKDREIEGRVVRTLQNEDDLLLVFPVRVGVEFATPDPSLEVALKSHSVTSSRVG